MEDKEQSVERLTPEILKGLIEECLSEQGIGVGPLMTETPERLVKLDIDTLKYFVYETLREKSRNILLESPTPYSPEGAPPIS